MNKDKIFIGLVVVDAILLVLNICFHYAEGH